MQNRSTGPGSARAGTHEEAKEATPHNAVCTATHKFYLGVEFAKKRKHNLSGRLQAGRTCLRLVSEVDQGAAPWTSPCGSAPLQAANGSTAPAPAPNATAPACEQSISASLAMASNVACGLGSAPSRLGVHPEELAQLPPELLLRHDSPTAAEASTATVRQDAAGALSAMTHQPPRQYFIRSQIVDIFCE